MSMSREQFKVSPAIIWDMDQDEENDNLSGMGGWMITMKIPIQNEMLIFLGSIVSINYAY